MTPDFAHLARFSSPTATPGARNGISRSSLDEIWLEMSEINTENSTRISSHLLYTEQLLRMRDTRHLSEAQSAFRQLLLDLLLMYTTKGDYPEDYDNQSGPTIVHSDGSGRLCAVGFLVERTAGPGLVKHLLQLTPDRLPYDPSFMTWLSRSGLDLEELQMIHPAHRNGNSEASPAFAALQRSSQERDADLYAQAFVHGSKARLKFRQGFEDTATAGLQADKQILTRAVADSFGSAGGYAPDEQPRRLKAFFIPNTMGEPVVALTFY